MKSTGAQAIHSELFTREEAAKYLKTSVSWLANRSQDPEGPPITYLGRSVRYNRSDLDAWVTKTTSRIQAKKKAQQEDAIVTPRPAPKPRPSAPIAVPEIMMGEETRRVLMSSLRGLQEVMERLERKSR